MEPQLVTALGPGDPDDGDPGRQARGMAIAALVQIEKSRIGYKVPSQSGAGSYVVNVDDDPICTCPDFEKRQVRCKHVYAVEYVIQRQEQADGSAIETKAMRVTYSQDWPAYNAAQTSEKDTFQVLLAELCSNVPQPEYSFGRPRLPLSDMIFTGAAKVYSLFSARRFDSDVRDAHRKGFISVPPSFNLVNRYIANPDLRPVITDLIERSAEPLSVVESTFAADSSGFSTCRFDRWYDEKWGKTKSQRQWLKAHIGVGTLTKIIAAVDITPGNVHDSPMLPGLLNSIAKQFTMDEVSADKAYLSDANLRHIEGHGAYPYIPFKSNTTGKGSPMWRRLYGYFLLNEESWKAHYHQRSNVETAFSMVKGKFGDSVRAKSDAGQVNEILLKILCHNICVLVQAIHQIGIAPSFRPAGVGGVDGPVELAGLRRF